MLLLLQELTEDERAIASACATFGTTTAQQNYGPQLSPSQQRQLKEQQQVMITLNTFSSVDHGAT